ncbi:MAG: hypothetical protein LBD41_01905, partial [Clostridiales Family XIII bacterium]|nr:hypothetical protein [Clostridiales Family XIII bacterium]
KAQFNTPIQIDEINRFIKDSPIFFGSDYSFLPVVRISDLIKAAVTLYSDYGEDLKIYNNNTLSYGPQGSGKYLAIINDRDMIGFDIVAYANDGDNKTVIYSFMCRNESEELFGDTCYDPVISQRGRKMNLDSAVRNDEILKRAHRDSDSSPWESAG